MIGINLKLKQDFLVFSIVFKFHKFHLKLLELETTSQIMAKFNEQRAITPEGLLLYRPC